MAAVANMNGGTSFTEELTFNLLDDSLKGILKFNSSRGLSGEVVKHPKVEVTPQMYFMMNVMILSKRYSNHNNLNITLHQMASKALGYTGDSEVFVGKDPEYIIKKLKDMQGTVYYNSKTNKKGRNIITHLEYDIGIQIRNSNENIDAIIIECDSKIHNMNSCYTDELKTILCKIYDIRLIRFNNTNDKLNLKEVSTDRFEVGAETARQFNIGQNYENSFKKLFDTDGKIKKVELNKNNNDMKRLIDAECKLIKYTFETCHTNELYNLNVDKIVAYMEYNTSIIKNNWQKAYVESNKKLADTDMVYYIPEIRNDFIQLVKTDDDIKRYNAYRAEVDTVLVQLLNKYIMQGAERHLKFISNAERDKQLKTTPLFTSSKEALFRCSNCGHIEVKTIKARTQGYKCSKCKHEIKGIAKSKKEYLEKLSKIKKSII